MHVQATHSHVLSQQTYVSDECTSGSVPTYQYQARIKTQALYLAMQISVHIHICMPCELYIFCVSKFKKGQQLISVGSFRKGMGMPLLLALGMCQISAMVSGVNLVGSRITQKTNFWTHLLAQISLWGDYLDYVTHKCKGLPPVGGTIPYLGSWTEWRKGAKRQSAFIITLCDVINCFKFLLL